MLSLFALGLSAESWPEKRTFVWLLPPVACLFVFASIWRQMKNYFVAGLLFFAAGVFRLEQEVFPGRWGWPIFLLACGLALMTAAENYSAIRVALQKRFRG